MMENQSSTLVSGQSIIARECPKCGRKNARGVYFVREFDGRHVFKCDICGRKRSMGWTEASHLLMVEEKGDLEKSAENRERWRREMVEKFNEDFQDASEDLTEELPDAVENFEHMLKGPQLE